jgi:hypothetical protein
MKQISLSFAFLFLMACQNNNPAPAGPKQSLDLYVRLMSQENKISAQAEMKNTDDVPMEIPGGIRFQGVNMRLIPLQGVMYQHSFAARYIPEIQFDWGGGKAPAEQAKSDFPQAANFHFSREILDRSKPDTLRWEGGPLGKGESLVCLWEHLGSRNTIPWEISSTGPLSEIVFPSSKLKELEPAGQWSLYLVRKRLQKAETAGANVNIICEYYSQTDTMTVK